MRGSGKAHKWGRRGLAHNREGVGGASRTPERPHGRTRTGTDKHGPRSGGAGATVSAAGGRRSLAKTGTASALGERSYRIARWGECFRFYARGLVFQGFQGGGGGFGGGDGAEGFFGGGGVSGDVAAALVGFLQNRDIFADGTSFLGVGDAKYGYEGCSEGCGEVHAAAIVANGGLGEGEDGGKFEQVGFSGQIETVWGGCGGDLLANGVFGVGSEGDDGAAGFGDECCGGFGVMFHGPAFGGAAGGSGDDGYPRMGELREFGAHDGEGGLRNFQGWGGEIRYIFVREE